MFNRMQLAPQAIDPVASDDNSERCFSSNPQRIYKAVLTYLCTSGMSYEQARDESETALTEAMCELVGSGCRPTPAALMKQTLAIAMEKLFQDPASSSRFGRNAVPPPRTSS